MTGIIKSVCGDEINLSKVGIFYNKDNQKAKYVSSNIEKILKEIKLKLNDIFIITVDTQGHFFIVDKSGNAPYIVENGGQKK